MRPTVLATVMMLAATALLAVLAPPAQASPAAQADQQASPQAHPQADAQTQPPADPATPPVGPDADSERLSIRAVAIYDIRVRHIGTPINDRRSQFQLITRLEGSAIPDVTRLSYPVFIEYRTDMNEHLVDYTKRAGREDITHPYERPDMIRQSEYIDLPLDVDMLPGREATKLARVAGYVWVVLGGAVEPVWIPHAKRLEGGYLEHPRLEELGIRIRMLTADEAPEIADGRSYALVIEAGQEHVRNIAAFDPWLRNTRVQPQQVRREGVTYTVFRLFDQPFTDDWELGVYVFPNPEKLRIPFEFHDVELP